MDEGLVAVVVGGLAADEGRQELVHDDGLQRGHHPPPRRLQGSRGCKFTGYGQFFSFESQEHPNIYRVAQNHGKQVLRITHTKFHLPITQFVVIPHG